MCRSGSLMYVHCIRSYRLLGHRRPSPCPLSSMKGFTLELLKVSYACSRSGTVSSAWTAISGRSSLFGIGGPNTLGLLQRSLVVTCLFVPRRNRKTYWGYVVQPANGALVGWLWLIYCPCEPTCYVILAIDDTKCHVTASAIIMAANDCPGELYTDKW